MITRLRRTIGYVKWAFLIALFVVTIGFVAIVSLRVVVPALAVIEPFSSWEWLEGTNENTTIITNREEILIRDDDRLDRVVENVNSAVAMVMVQQPSPEGVQYVTGIVMTSDGLAATTLPEFVDPDTAVFSVMTHDGEFLDANYYAYDAYLNVIYIRVQDGEMTAMPFANADDFGAGRKVVAVESSQVERSHRVALGVVQTFDPTFSLAPQVLASSELHQGVFDVSFLGESVSPGAAVVSYGGELVGMYGQRNVGDREEMYVLDANTLRESLDRVIANPERGSSYFGVSYTPITSTLARAYNLDVQNGAWLAFPDRASGAVVLFDSPAQEAGLRYGDIILSVNDIPITIENSLAAILRNAEPNETITLSVWRSGETIALTATLEEMPQ